MINIKNEFKIGDILYSSWGYDQTNIDFFKIKKFVGKTMIELVPIESKMVECDSPYEDRVVPYPAKEGKPFRRKIKFICSYLLSQPYVSINSYSSAHIWEGKPLAQTNPYYGH
jgi:hypothetical protein